MKNWEACMRTHFLKIVTLLILAFGLPASSCFALEWEIERNFRYFVYPSDVAIQRVAADLHLARRGAFPTPEQLELLINGPDFWTTSLQVAGGRRNLWPAEW